MIELDTRYSAEDRAVEVIMQRGDTVRAVTYTSEDADLVACPEGAVAGLLLVAMASGEDIHLAASLDPAFRRHLDTVQDIYTTWSQALSRVTITEKTSNPQARRRKEKHSPQRTAAFFSGGVDSFYTFLKRRASIEALVFVHGFDVSLNDASLRTKVSQKLREAAAAYDKQLIEVETTLRDVTDQKRMTPRFYNWELSHGSALASVAHALSGSFDRILIPATHTYNLIYPFGSHPLLDPLWSSSQLDIVQDGCEAGRIEKCEFISNHDPALNALRVCWKNPGAAYNCGQCEKCVRTMLILKSLGALDRCSTFRRALTPSDVMSTWIKEERWERYYKAILARMERKGDNDSMRLAIKTALHYSRMKRGARSVLQRILN